MKHSLGSHDLQRPYPSRPLRHCLHPSDVPKGVSTRKGALCDHLQGLSRISTAPSGSASPRPPHRRAAASSTRPSRSARRCGASASPMSRAATAFRTCCVPAPREGRLAGTPAASVPAPWPPAMQMQRASSTARRALPLAWRVRGLAAGLGLARRTSRQTRALQEAAARGGVAGPLQRWCRVVRQPRVRS